jgi:hypothetical protein
LGAQEFIRNDGLFFVQTGAPIDGMIFESLERVANELMV